MKIADLMSQDVVTVRPETPVSEMKDLFHKHTISGAPVADAHGNLLGVVSLSDLSREKPVEEPKEVAFYANPSWGTIRFPTAGGDTQTVADIMTNLVISADQDEDLERAADLMVNHGIHRVIVTSAGKVVGVVSSFDLVKEFRNQMKAAKQMR